MVIDNVSIFINDEAELRTQNQRPVCTSLRKKTTIFRNHFGTPIVLLHQESAAVTLVLMLSRHIFVFN